jgi:hypothetical protein
MEDILNNDNAHGSQNISSVAAGMPEEISGGGWRSIDWKAQKANIKQPVISPSPVDVVMVRDRLVYLKRDDQLRLPGSQISGNKARKMLALNDLAKDDFPTCLVSYGGPQSNAMLALAAIVRFQNEKAGLGTDDPDRKRFVYYAKKLPRFLRNQPNGNLYRALSLGMELMEVSAEEYKDLFGGDSGGQSEAPKSLQAPVPSDSVWVRNVAYIYLCLSVQHVAYVNECRKRRLIVFSLLRFYRFLRVEPAEWPRLERSCLPRKLFRFGRIEAKENHYRSVFLEERVPQQCYCTVRFRYYSRPRPTNSILLS